MFKGSNVALITPFKNNNLDVESYIHFEEIGHSTEYYNSGSKHKVIELYENNFPKFFLEKL